jgi:2-iminobutanoate/2-iminopropanoate deaminase
MPTSQNRNQAPCSLETRLPPCLFFDVESQKKHGGVIVKKEIVTSPGAPAPIGPYSVAVKVGSLVFTSGQVGLDPATGTLVPGGIAAETRQVLTNLSAILKGALCSLEDVIKTTVFLTDMAEFSRMNEIYATFFSDNFPARSTVQVAALPKGAAVEIEAVATVK